MGISSFITVPLSQPFTHYGRARTEPHRPHRFATHPSSLNYADALLWCNDQFGIEDPYHRWHHRSFQIFIQGDDDAFAFKMRWC